MPEPATNEAVTTTRMASTRERTMDDLLVVSYVI
jgi:hypothetical protein